LYHAHSKNNGGFIETVGDHLQETSILAARFASVWDREEEGAATGLLHDLGKYTELFKLVLEGKAQQVDHATPGAHALLRLYKKEGVAAALAAQGHHDGLQIGRPKDLGEVLRMKEPVSPQNKTYSSRDVDTLLDCFHQDNLKLPPQIRGDYLMEYNKNRSVAAMLYVRMLFSALVDADFLATEAHFASQEKGGYQYRPAGKKLEPEKYLSILLEYMTRLREKSNASDQLNSLRDDLFNACLGSGKEPKGIYTLTAPTGAGKTLSMLAFALKHAVQHQLRRIIFVMPYLNIIEQNALVYREVFKNCGDNLILEDHSMVELPEEQRLFAENWDAPIVVTTTIRFFEGLFANRSSPCRRLHNIANSVILFDEAQSLPPQLAIYTLAAVSYLVERFGCSVVFSTATQPAFETFENRVKQHAASGWQPSELISEKLKLFDRTRKIRVEWKSHLPWKTIAREITAESQALAIVNTKKQAGILYQQAKEQLDTDKELYFLSTDMCPVHRLAVIEKVKTLLSQKESATGINCCLISTQCVEAGVDLDFPAVWRALGPLEAIIQAAGRCNRQGLLPFGRVVVFRPPMEDENFPDTAYEKGAAEVLVMLEQKGELDLEDPGIIKEYYHRYFIDNLHHFDKKKLADIFQQYDFLKVAQEYRWIKDSSINILVPYSKEIATYYNLCELARKGNFNRTWIKKARPLSVGYRVSNKHDIWDYLEPVQNRQKEVTGWYLLLNPDLYLDATGLIQHDGIVWG
jgi:CRISPR-associated endonuclease/helicase Cas3